MSVPVRAPRRPRAPLLAAAALVAVALVVAVARVAGGGGGDDERAADRACRELRGTLRTSPDGAPVCAVPRSAYAVERVRLRADGTLVASDAAARRSRCAADARRAGERARVRVRAGGAASFTTYRWDPRGVCRAARRRLSAAEVAEVRAAPLLSAARRALRTGDATAALGDARRADALLHSPESRALLARATRASAPKARPGAGAADQLVSPNEYLGLPCADVGHPFRVAPGSDPAHDPDGDGRACEDE